MFILARRMFASVPLQSTCFEGSVVNGAVVEVRVVEKVGVSDPTSCEDRRWGPAILGRTAQPR
jgi:hypothetical protein